jgi:hypothetical protein
MYTVLCECGTTLRYTYLWQAKQHGTLHRCDAKENAIFNGCLVEFHTKPFPHWQVT